MQEQGTVAIGAKTTRSGVKDGLLVVSGYGVRIAVGRSHLTIADGFPDERRSFRLSRATSRLKRLVMLGHSGTVSLEAMRWLHDVGAAFVQIDADGTVITVSAPQGTDEPRLRRLQALAPFTGAGLAIARNLIRLKVERQANVLSRIPSEPGAAIDLDEQLAAVDRAESIPTLRMAEANAARAYWSRWASLPVRFARHDQPQIPAHWATAGNRVSPLSGSPRKAANPVQAILNYLYAILEAETRIALLTVGLDPGLGVLHTDLAARDSLALDVMEAVRSEADAIALELIQRRTFAARDFHEMRDGVCRLVPPLPQSLASSAVRFRHAFGPVVESVCKQLVQQSPASAVFSESLSARLIKSVPLPTHLTEANRSAGRDSVRNRPPRQPLLPRVVSESACQTCGQVVPSDRDYCDDCLPEYREEAAQTYGALAVERLRQKRARGEDPTHTPDARAKQGRTNSANRAAEAEWDRLHPDTPDPSTFTTDILPLIQHVSNRALSRATGLSVTWCAAIKAGRAVPHPRHWEAMRANRR